MTTPIDETPREAYASFGAEQQQPTTADVIDPDSPPWGVGTGIGLWLLSVLLIFVMPALFVLPYVQMRGVAPEQLADFAITDPTAIFLQVLSFIPAHLVTLALAWAMVTRLGRRPFFRTLGWTWHEQFGPGVSALVAVFLFLASLVIIYFGGGPETQLDKIINSSRATAFLMALMATATAPLVEEVVYRGLLYSALRRAAGAAPAVVMVFALFALVHVPQYWPNFGIIAAISLLSLALTLVRAKTKSLLPCFVIHFVFNGVQAVLIVLNPYLPKTAPEGATGAHLAPVFAHLAALFG